MTRDPQAAGRGMPRRAALAGVVLPVIAGRIAMAAPASPLAELPPLGDVPAGFAVALTGGGPPPRWAVAEDATAAQGRAVTQLSAYPTDNRFPLLIWQGISAVNLAASVRFKAVAGRVDRAGGIVVRLTDAANYVVVRANALEDNVRLYRVVRGSRQQFAGADVAVTAGEWHSLALRAEGDRFTVAFNGRELFSARDPVIGGAGRVALWTKADSVTRFEALAVEPLS